MKIPFVFLVSFFSCTSFWTQISYQTGIGGDYEEYPRKIIQANDGGFYVLSSSSSPGTSGAMDVTNYGASYLWLIKYDSDYSIVWQKSYGGNASEGPGDMVLLNDGVLIGASSSSLPSTGNKTSPFYGQSDFWLLKVGFDGEIIWQQSYGGSGFESSIRKIITLDNGDFILLGSSNSNISGVKSENSYGDYDYWIVRVTANGTLLWDKTIGSTDTDDLLDYAFLPDNKLILTGISHGYAASGLKSQPNNSPLEDAWLVCIDYQGNIIWDRVLGGVMFERSSCVVADSEYIYHFVQSGSDPSGQRTTTRKGSYDIWMVKLELDGTIVFDKSFGGEFGESPANAHLSGDRIFIATDSPSGISHDKTEPSRGNFDYWPLAISLNGDLIAEKTIGGSDDDFLNQILPIQDGKILLMGSSRSPISGDKTTVNYGESDVWLVELEANTLSLFNQTITRAELFPNPCMEELHVIFEENSLVQRIQVTNATGKLVYQTTISNQFNEHLTIPTSEWAMGTYTLNIIGASSTLVKKFIKQ